MSEFVFKVPPISYGDGTMSKYSLIRQTGVAWDCTRTCLLDNQQSVSIRREASRQLDCFHLCQLSVDNTLSPSY